MTNVNIVKKDPASATNTATALQSDFGLAGTGAQLFDNVVDRVRYILETYPDTRDSYQALMMRYWLEFDGLRDLLTAPDKAHVLIDWFTTRATSPKTLQNRAMEVKRR